jgi:hypothetical protein
MRQAGTAGTMQWLACCTSTSLWLSSRWTWASSRVFCWPRAVHFICTQRAWAAGDNL